MSNRAQRRAMMRNQINKSQQLLANYSKQQRMAGLVQNGITPKDLEEEFQRGREIGFKEAAEPISAFTRRTLDERMPWIGRRSRRVL